MAEGLLRHLAGDQLDVFSAGTRATTVNPTAITVMDELGIDIRGQFSKTLDRYLNQPFDAVITVCDTAADNCPFLPGKYHRLHWSFPDPAAVAGDEARLAAFRNVRDGLAARFRAWLPIITGIENMTPTPAHQSHN